MILLIDNYDSFTYNLVHYISELGAKVQVVRNDAITVDEVLKNKNINIYIMIVYIYILIHIKMNLFGGLLKKMNIISIICLILKD